MSRDEAVEALAAIAAMKSDAYPEDELAGQAYEDFLGAVEIARSALAAPQPDPDAPLSLRRRAAAAICVEAANRLKALGFGSEIIATWDTDAGSERTAAHVVTANPERAPFPSILNDVAKERG